MEMMMNSVTFSDSYDRSNKESLISKLGATVALVALLAAAPAYAADVIRQGGMKDDVPVAGTVINWTGFYIGGQAGVNSSNHKLEAQGFDGKCTGGSGASSAATDATAEEKCTSRVVPGTWTDTAIPGANAFIDGLDAHGGFVGGRVGADWAIRGSRFVVGVLGDYNFTNADMKFGAGSGALAGSIDEGNSWMLGGRLGYTLGEERRTLIYGLAGYGQQDVSYNISAGGTSLFNKDVTFNGWTAGAGMEYALNQAISVGIEYQHFFGGKKDLFNDLGTGCDETVVTDKVDTDRVMGRINFKVGPGLFGY